MAFAESIFKKSILKIQNKILFGIFKIKYYFENTILHITGIWTMALLSSDVEEVMLGADWLHANRCVWNFGSGKLSINGCPAITLTRKGHIKCRRVLVREPMEIPPRSQTDVPARITQVSMKPTRNDVMIETRQLRNGVHVGRTLLPPDENHFKVCVVNTTNRPQLLTAGTLLGNRLLSVRSKIINQEK